MEKYIYVIFSSTPFKISKCIRVITRNFYNHASISIDPQLGCFYSFARRYRNAPLYGGFVEESRLRYIRNNIYSSFKIAKVPVSQEQYESVQKTLQQMRGDEFSYIYNTFSAAAAAFGRKVIIDRSYTCIEFVIHILSSTQIINDFNPKKNYTINMLEQKLREYTFFEGEIDLVSGQNSWGDDHFDDERNRFALWGLSLSSNARLLGRYIRRKFT